MIPREELLYDRERLRHYKEEHGGALHIKRNVETTAFVYEIRTALRYWFGGRNDYRCNDVVWHNCEMIEDGLAELQDGELVHFPERAGLSTDEIEALS